HNPDNKSWSLTEREGWLRLHTVQNAKSLLHARNTLTMRTEGPACSGAVKVDASGMKPGDRAGISAFQYKYGCVGVLVDDSGAKKIYYANNGGYGGDDVMGSYDAIKEQVPMSGDEAYFKVDFRFANVTADGSASNNIDKVNFYYSLDGMNWTKIGEEIGMDYNLKLFTGYRSGLYCYSTKQTGGYADFDYFDYEREEWNPPTAEKNEPEDPNGYLFHDTFDKGLCGWTGRGSAKVSVSTDVTFDSSAGALHATDRDKDWNGATKQLSRSKFKAGQSYSFSVNACYTEGTEEEDTLYLKLQYVGADEETHYETIDEQLVKKGDWVQLANSSYPIPEGASNVYIYVETIDTTNNFYIDEAIGAPDGTEIEGPGGGVKVPVIPGDADADGTVNAKDLTVLKRVLLTEGKFASKAAEKNADVNGDGKVDADDAKALAAYLSGES
ncbi:MAG: carbohydrate binding domain-containing protein, partial [Oscillospiraceae bacterium]|nr:carbohydrate binding domain-containing protein [Oscillospiraceae bacterium]